MINPVYQIVAVRTGQASLLGLLAHWLLGWPLIGPHALGLFLTPALCLYFVFVFVAPLTWGLPILTRLPSPNSSTVCLTFDDGPSVETTPRILDALREYNIHATFFVLGEAVDRCPEMLSRIAAEGHSVGLHGYRHRPFVLMGGRQMQEEIMAAQAAVQRAGPGVPVISWLRPPHGFKSLEMLWAVRLFGSRLAAWSLDSRDYRASDPVCLTAYVLNHLHPGAIVLLHDGPANTVTAEALPSILRGLQERGWSTALLP